MKELLLAVLVLCACSQKAEPPPKNEFEAFERKYRGFHAFLLDNARKNGKTIEKSDLDPSYRAVFIGPSGVFVDRKLVATLAELDSKRADIVSAIDANIAMLPSVRWSPVVTFALDKEPASVAVSALRLLEGMPVQLMRVIDDPDLPARANEVFCPAPRRDDVALDPATKVNLSILLDTNEAWVGLSLVNDFQPIANQTAGYDFEKLESVLKQKKSSVFFSDRTDLEIGAKAGTSGDLLAAMRIACKVGFRDPMVVPADKLSAIPKF